MHSGRRLHCLLLFLLMAPGCPANSPRSTGSRYHLRGIERRISLAINQQRRDHDMSELKWNGRLAEEARRHSTNMAGRHFFSHTDPVRGDMAARLKKDKIPWRDIAENIFEEEGYADPVEQAISSWMKSPGHRRNILDPKYTYTGVGAAVRADGTLFITQEFLLP